ncbi:MAG: hypothetical protein R2818_15030 [Flavobacteriales bacterium]
MRIPISLFLCTAITMFSACSSDKEDTDATPEEKEQKAMDEAAACDPLVGEFRDLMADYETSLKDMVANKKIDPQQQEKFSAKANDLSARIKERGEKALGLKCWNEFNAIGQTYGPRIAKLGMEAMMMEGGMEGMENMDPAAMEQLKKMMGQ